MKEAGVSDECLGLLVLMVIIIVEAAGAVQKGPNAGKWFWACTGYPKSRKVLEVEVG